MAKKQAKQKKRTTRHEPIIKPETRRGVIGLLSFAFAIVLVLAGFQAAGAFGRLLHDWLGLLFGVGYWLVPFSLFVFSVALFRAFEHRLGVLKTATVAFSFLLGLALIEVLAPGFGGWVGALIAQPVVWAFDTVAGSILLFAAFLASLLVIFDSHPHQAFPSVLELWKRLREKKSKGEVLDAAESQRIAQATTPTEEQLPPANAQEAEQETPASETKSAFAETVKKTEKIIDYAKEKGQDVLESMSFKGQETFGAYTPPPLSILRKDSGRPRVGDVKANANAIKRTLMNFGISVEMDEVSIGPTVTRYALKPAEGVRLNRIVSLQSNLELALAASPIRIEAPIPGKSLVGIEVPNTAKTTVGLAPLLAHPDFRKSEKPLLIALGRDIAGTPHYASLAKMPHLLIAGTTGSGKSVTLHNLIVSLLYRHGPEALRLVMVDPKRVELSFYNDIPHLLTPVITDPKKVILALKWLAKEMERRYDLLQQYRVRDIASYHKNVYERFFAKHQGIDKDELPEDAPPTMPYIVAILDELGDLMQIYPRELEGAIVRLAQMSRAVGIHLVLTTQNPTVKVVTGLIKANIPARLALKTATQVESRVILDMAGAEKLLGAGDMLFLSGETSKPKRMQAPFISEDEVKKVVRYLKDSYADVLEDTIDLEAEAQSESLFVGSVGDDDEEEDPLFEEAKQIVIAAGKASTSYLQRKLRVGYARAARLMDLLEERGIIGPAEGSKPRPVLVRATEETSDDAATEEPEPTPFFSPDHGEKQS